MKQTRLLLVVLVMIASLVGVQSAEANMVSREGEPLGDNRLSIYYSQTLVEKLVGMQLPSAVVGTEKVLLYVGCVPFSVDVADGAVTAVAAGQRDDATLRLQVTEETIQKLVSGELSFADAMKQQQILFEPVSLKNRIKLFFADLISSFTGYKIQKGAILCDEAGEGTAAALPDVAEGPLEYVMTIYPGPNGKHPLDKPLLEIRSGDKVTFSNKDTIDHLLMLREFSGEEEARTLISTIRQPLAIGEEASFSFGHVGEVLIEDEVSSELRGKIVVSERCGGCLVNGVCLDVGAKVALEQPVYCSGQRTLEAQKSSGISCTFAYECLSNACDDNTCSG